MSYFDSPRQRKIILDKLRVMRAQAADSSLFLSFLGKIIKQNNSPAFPGKVKDHAPVSYIIYVRKNQGVNYEAPGPHHQS